jgi:hypothetical protein
MTRSSQRSSAAAQGYQSYGPSWQAYDYPQGGYGGPQMFPLSNVQDMGNHLQEHPKCLQHRLETIQSFGRLRPPQLHQDDCPAHLGDPPFAFQ